MAAPTPMMQQYFDLKKQYADCILFFRLGDFYEMFNDDAIKASEILGIALTARNKGENRMQMCGVPFHAANGYIAKLTAVGMKVAICEQLSDPTLPGIVERGVIRVITPGTTLDDNVLDQKSSNFLAALSVDSGVYDLAMVEVSTGDLAITRVSQKHDLINLFEKYKPAELIYHDSLLGDDNLEMLCRHFTKMSCFHEAGTIDYKAILEEQFGIFKLDFSENESRFLSVGMLINYLKATQKTSLDHLNEIREFKVSDFMSLDESTIKNLELLENAREKKVEGSLLGVLDKTVTSAGGRLLKKIIIEPLTDLSAINSRLDQVEFLKNHTELLLDLRLFLKRVADIERVTARLVLGTGNARDMRLLVQSFEHIAQIKNTITTIDSPLFAELVNLIDCLPELINRLDAAIVDEPPISTRDGGMIKDGFDSSLDEYKNLSREGKSFIQQMQIREIERTKINSLKVRFNRVFGYYIEISKANLAQAPADYERKQTLVNAERFTTPELKEYERKVLSAEEKIVVMEENIFRILKSEIAVNAFLIKQTAAQISYLDLLCTFALVSWENKYVRPKIGNGFNLVIENGRHPVVEKLNPTDRFIPNDLKFESNMRLMLITGPNMGGKSTFLRQNALIVLMAHIGIFVPASNAYIPLVDKIFTRVGASDNLVKGQSTFWVEMSEAALILKEATENSLVILDEIGRGTSTFDGVSIAWGIMEFLHDSIKAKTLFASHYHELIALADRMPRAANFSVQAHEQDGEVVFLYKILAGAIDRSYGIEVAKLAGLPLSVIERAKEILIELENEKIGDAQQTLSFDDARTERAHQTSNLDDARTERAHQTSNLDDARTERAHQTSNLDDARTERAHQTSNLDDARTERRIRLCRNLRLKSNWKG